MVICLGMVGVETSAGGTRDNSPDLKNTMPASRYIVSGDRQGKVTVKDAVSLEVIRTFQMDSGVVVREVFLLDGGKTVGASQKDKAIFWDLDTGREIRRLNQRIYGFSHDEKKFFTFYHPEGVVLYAYPNLARICQLKKWPSFGPRGFRFSPDDRFLAIQFQTGFPSRDENYPYSDTVTRGIVYTKLFHIPNCQEIQEFSALRISSLGQFSPDSKFYDLKNVFTYIEGGRLPTRGSWRFDLTTYKVEKNSAINFPTHEVRRKLNVQAEP